MKLRLAALLLLILPLAGSDPALAQSKGKLPDGRWHITLRGHGPYLLCYGQITRVGEVRGGRPVYSGQAKYRFHVAANGHVTASGTRKVDRASLRGQIRNGRTGSGTFTIPTRNCSGTWQVTKVGD